MTQRPTDLRKLTIEEHRQIAMHLHAADHHLMKVINLMSDNPWLLVPTKIVYDIEEVRDRLGAASSPSRHTQGDIVHRCAEVFMAERPDSDDVYYSNYADCAGTLAMDSPDKPSDLQPKQE
jgi:hypothetical protein